MKCRIISNKWADISSSIRIREVTLFECIRIQIFPLHELSRCRFLQKRCKFSWKSTNRSYTSRSYDVSRGAHANGTVLEFLWTELGQYSIFDVEQIDIGNWKISFEKIISKLIVECKIANENWDDREVV